NLDKMLKAAGAGVQSSADPECNLQRPECNLQESGVQSSIAGVQSSIAHNRPALPPVQPPPPPPATKSGWRLVVNNNHAAMGVPPKAVEAVLDKLVAEHGDTTATQVLLKFLKRDFTGLRHPWSPFMREVDTLKAVVLEARAAAVRDAAEQVVIEQN